MIKKIIKKIFLIFFTVLILILVIGSFYVRGLAKKSIVATSMFNVDGKSCYLDKKQKSSVKYNSYKACDAPFKLADWTYEIKDNNDVIIINLQGGPNPVLRGFTQWADKPIPGKNSQDNIDSKYSREKPYRMRVPSEYEYPVKIRKNFGYNYNDYDVSFVKEMWHMKHNMYAKSYKLTLDQAQQETAEYMDILEKIINEYKTKYKKVIVFGHSLGGVQVNELLRTKGTIADGFVSSAGRLHMPKQIVKSFLKKRLHYFDVNGNPEKITFKDNLMSFVRKHILINEGNLAVHSSALGSHNYLEGIKEAIDAGKFTHNNIVWITSEYDRQVGVFNEKEKAFAKKHGTLIYYSKKYIQENKDYFKKQKMIRIENFPIEKSGHSFMLTQKENDKWTKILNI